MYYSRSHVHLSDVVSVASQCAEIVTGGDVIVFHGDIGAGKTTFISQLVHALGSSDEVTSPTFAISSQYAISGRDDIRHVIHIDTYRLSHVNELYDLGWETLFTPESLTCIEWGERIEELLDRPHYRIDIDEENPEYRDYTISFGEAHAHASSFLENHGWISG